MQMPHVAARGPHLLQRPRTSLEANQRLVVQPVIIYLAY